MSQISQRQGKDQNTLPAPRGLHTSLNLSAVLKPKPISSCVTAFSHNVIFLNLRSSKFSLVKNNNTLNKQAADAVQQFQSDLVGW